MTRRKPELILARPLRSQEIFGIPDADAAFGRAGLLQQGPLPSPRCRPAARAVQPATFALACTLTLALLGGQAASGQEVAAPSASLKLATTTSTENSGLLDCLLPAFRERTGIDVRVIAVGTGKALKLGENGDVDVLLVHAPAAELRFVAAGFGVGRRAVMHNTFVLLGPPSDPAGARASRGVVQALKTISAARAAFFSRGDDSGTHKKELSLWAEAGLEPAGDWYMETGQGMGRTLILVDQKQGYTLCDRATYLALRAKVSLVVVSEGDARLHNPYSVIAVNPARHPHVHREAAAKLIDWLTSAEARQLITAFQRGGEQLFWPDRPPLAEPSPAERAAAPPPPPPSLGSAWETLLARRGALGEAVWVSLTCSLLATLIAGSIGVLLGAALALARFRGKGALSILLNTTTALPTVVVGLLGYSLLSRAGPLGATALLYTKTAIVLGEVVLITPIVAVFTQASLEQLDPSALKTARTLGASRSSTLGALLLEVRFGIMAGVVAGFGRAVGEVGIAMMLGGNIAHHTRTMTTVIALETSKGEFTLGLTLGLILLTVALGANILFRSLQAKGQS